MKHQLITATFAAFVASTAMAQTTKPNTDHPTPIATSQQTADEASQKAAQENVKTGKFVRTGPSAADHVSHAATKTKDKATQTKDAVTNDTRSTTQQ